MNGEATDLNGPKLGDLRCFPSLKIRPIRLHAEPIYTVNVISPSSDLT